MITKNNIYIGESLLKDVPKKALTLKIKDGTITAEKLDPALIEKIEGGGSDLSAVVDKIRDVVEKFDNPNYKHSVGFTKSESVVAVGDKAVFPGYKASWDGNIRPIDGKEGKVEVSGKSLIIGTGNDISWTEDVSYIWTADDIDVDGNVKFSYSYIYPKGEYTIYSNLGEEKIIEVPEARVTTEHPVYVTYPCLINDTKYLIKIGEEKVIKDYFQDSPTILVPYEYSTIEVKVSGDDGKTYNDVEGWEYSIVEIELYKGVKYKKCVGYSSFNKPLLHQITIKIVKDV